MHKIGHQHNAKDVNQMTDHLANKTAKIDRAVYLAVRMQEEAVAHTELVERFARHDDPEVTEAQIKASAERWVECKRDLRDFLAIAISE